MLPSGSQFPAFIVPAATTIAAASAAASSDSVRPGKGNRCPGAVPVPTLLPMRSPPPPLPARVGPCEFNMLGAMVAVRCPQEFADIILRAGGLWEPGSRRWLVERRRIGPVIRALQRATDPLFRHAGMSLD